MEIKRSLSEAAVAVAADLGSAPYELAALHSLAYTRTLTGRYDRAVTVSLRRMELSREIGDARGEGLADGVLGEAYHRMGKYELATKCLLQAMPLFQKHHAPDYHALCLQKLGHAYEGMGRYPEAIGYLEQSMLMFRQLLLPRKVEQARQALDRCQTAKARYRTRVRLTLVCC
jgi:tetratricopeptide (TPR) repeat protein